MHQLTKEQIIELGSNDMLAEALGFGYTSTTIGMNGYPESVKYAIVSDSIKELNETIEYLEKLGFEVEKFELHKRDGWGLWNRTSIWGFEAGQYQTVGDQDWCFDYNPEWSEEEAKKAIAEETTSITKRFTKQGGLVLVIEDFLYNFEWTSENKSRVQSLLKKALKKFLHAEVDRTAIGDLDIENQIKQQEASVEKAKQNYDHLVNQVHGDTKHANYMIALAEATLETLKSYRDNMKFINLN